MKQFEQLAGKLLAGVQALPASTSAKSRCLRQSLHSRYWQLAQVILCMVPSLNVNAMKTSNLERIYGLRRYSPRSYLSISSASP
jgi:hypothetical protein